MDASSSSCMAACLPEQQLQQACWLQPQIESVGRSSYGERLPVVSRAGDMEASFGGGGGSGLSWDCRQEMGSFSGCFEHSSSGEVQSRVDYPDDKTLAIPVLQYISDMLMDDRMEDQICMLQECSAYQATAKGFYEILGQDSSSFSSGTQRTPGDSGGETHGTEEWIDELLNSNPMKRAEEAPSTLSTGVASLAPEIMETVDFPPQRSFGSSGNPDHICSCQSCGRTFPSNDLPHAPYNDLALKHNHPAAGGLVAKRVSYVRAGEMLEDSIFHNDAILQTGSDPDRSLYVQEALPSRPLANRVAFDKNVSGFNAKLSEENQFLSLPRKVEEYHDNAKPFPSTADTSLFPANGNISGRQNYKSELSATQLDKRMLGQEDRHYHYTGESQCANLQIAYTMTGTTKEMTLSFVQNKAVNAEFSANLIRDRPAPSCAGMHLLTSRKHEPRAAITKRGLRNETKTKHSGKPDTVDLVGILVGCAQAIACGSLTAAQMLLHEIRKHASPYGSATERLAHYVAEALVARISGTGPRLYTAVANGPSSAKLIKAYRLYVPIYPYATISHFFANQSILKASEGASRLHIVDYGILNGFQWPCLMSALAERNGGPPHLRITGIEFPSPGCNPEERVQETGRRLTKYAKAYGVPFEFRAIVGKWENVQPTSLNILQDEVLIVNCMNRWRHLMDETEIAASPRQVVLSKIRSMNPKFFVQGVVNAGLNTSFFTSRFREALFYYSSRLDILETITVVADNPERLMVEKEMIGRDILNVVACEGLERVERPETYRQCQSRIEGIGEGGEARDLQAMPVSHRTSWV